MSAGLIEHWFNRRYGAHRRDVYLYRLPTGWQVVGRIGGSDGQKVPHFFDDEADARAMLARMLAAVPAELSNWARQTRIRRH